MHHDRPRIYELATAIVSRDLELVCFAYAAADDQPTASAHDMRRIGIASGEWPVVIYGACLGITWTMGSLAWVFMSDTFYSLNTALGWLQGVPLLPAFVSVTIGEALYRSGFGFEWLGIAFGALVAAFLCIAGLLVLARRS